MSSTPALTDFRWFCNCEEVPVENISLVTGAVMGEEGEGSPVSVPSSGCLAVCSGVGWLPPSRSARSPVTQSSPSWLRARPPREGRLSQTQRACIDMSMLPGLFTVPNCWALAESPPRRGINWERNDNSLLNSWSLGAAWGRVIYSQVHAWSAGLSEKESWPSTDRLYSPVNPL